MCLVCLGYVCMSVQVRVHINGKSFRLCDQIIFLDITNEIIFKIKSGDGGKE